MYAERRRVMDVEMINLVYHSRGRWVHVPSLSYIEENENVENIDIDFLSLTHMVKKYREEFGMPKVSKLYYLQPEHSLDNGLTILEDDVGINKMVQTAKSLIVDESIHIYPGDENVGDRPYLGTQCSGINQHDLGVCKGSVSNASGWERGLINDDDIIIDDLIDVSLVCGNETETEAEIYGDKTVLESNLENDYEGSEDESDSEGVDLAVINQGKRRVKYDVEDNNPHFLLGMSFANAKEARLAIARYGVAMSTPLRLKPNEKNRIRAKCRYEGCPFQIFISSSVKQLGLTVKRIDSDHNCLKDAKNKLASAKFLANEFKRIVYENPKVTAKALKSEAERNMKLYVSYSKCKRVKRLVTSELEGSYLTQFSYLGAYLGQVTEENPGTTTQLELNEDSLENGKLVFKRLYICFDALKRGWKAGCKPIICVDGCHLKGVVKGQVLAAVGQDGANQLFPIAWAVIDKENKENWTWFLQLLVKDLEIDELGANLTIVSDMQKGLVQAVIDVLPRVEHRYCARHVHANWSKKWHGEELKKRFWMCVWSNYKEEFDDNLKLLGGLSKQAASDFVAYNPQVFCRAFFSTRCKSDMVDNNLCESFNSTIGDARLKPIVSMLNDIRTAAMKRLASNKLMVHQWTSQWSPPCMQAYQDNMEGAFGCRVIFNGASAYEIGDDDDRHVVYVDRNMCTCRAWDVTGIPCSHVICALNHAKKDPKSLISHWYHKATYMAAYEHAMQPVPVKQFLKEDAFEILAPPPVFKLSGRPRNKRIRSARESMRGKTKGKLPKNGVIMTCSNCHSEDHNRASCPKKSAQVQICERNHQPRDEIMVSRAMNQQKSNSIRFQKGKQNTNESGKCFKRSKMTIGLGLYVDETSGNTSLNPGMPSETIIAQRDPIASQPLSSEPDPIVRYPIPIERELRKEQHNLVLSKSSGSRRIAFAGDGTQSILPVKLPFKPPGPTRKGHHCMTTGQLERQRDSKMAKKGK